MRLKRIKRSLGREYAAVAVTLLKLTRKDASADAAENTTEKDNLASENRKE
jgi:hypothetical protein